MAELITPQLIEEVINAESSGRANAVSGKGARGLMQMTPIAWKDVRGSVPELAGYDYDANWANPDVNRRFGSEYLKIVQRYLPAEYRESLPHVLAGYNAGVGTLKKIGYDLNRAPKETKDYIKKITDALTIRTAADSMQNRRVYQ
jgi:soluble lytic murein transglycosylase